MNSFVGEDEYFILYSEFNWETVQRSQYGGNVVSDIRSSQYMRCCILLHLETWLEGKYIICIQTKVLLDMDSVFIRDC